MFSDCLNRRLEFMCDVYHVGRLYFIYGIEPAGLVRILRRNFRTRDETNVYNCTCYGVEVGHGPTRFCIPISTVEFIIVTQTGTTKLAQCSHARAAQHGAGMSSSLHREKNY